MSAICSISLSWQLEKWISSSHSLTFCRRMLFVCMFFFVLSRDSNLKKNHTQWRSLPETQKPHQITQDNNNKKKIRQMKLREEKKNWREFKVHQFNVRFSVCVLCVHWYFLNFCASNITRSNSSLTKLNFDWCTILAMIYIFDCFLWCSLGSNER